MNGLLYHLRCLWARMRRLPTPDAPNWWPPHHRWPAYPMQRITNALSSRLFGNEAAALMLADEVLFIGSSGTLCVMCNDLFWWGCADCEDLPHHEGRTTAAAFWDLYDRVRRDGHYGAHVWCCLRRGMRPQTPIEREWREGGLWTAELEALPPRDPKDCG